MRVTELLIAIGAGLGFASAGIVCNPKALHNATQVIDDTANEGFKKLVEGLCSSHNTKNVTEGHFGSITLGLNRTCSDCTYNAFCAQQFDSIIKECVAGQTLAGGTAKFHGMTAEVSIDASLIETAQAKAQDFRKMRVARMVKKGGKKTTPPKSKPKKGKTTIEAEKSKTTPNKSKTTPKPNACRARKNPNKTTPGKKTPGEKTLGKKGFKNALRSVISKLFPRAPPSSDDFPMSPSDEETLKNAKSPKRPAGGAKRPAGSPAGSPEKPAKRPAEGPAESPGKGKGKADEFDPSSSQEEAMAGTCFLEQMHKPAGWNGEVFFGQAQPNNDAPTFRDIQDIAEEAWNYIVGNIPHGNILVVAALYVPGKGVYVGTIPTVKGGAEAQFEEELKSFAILAKAEEYRFAYNIGGAKYHAEDAAMWYAFKNGAVGPNDKFPKESIMAAFGSKGRAGSKGVPMAACGLGEHVQPSCQQILRYMLQKN